MVKLSRRGASNGRSRRSLKKRSSRKQVLTGGEYQKDIKEYERLNMVKSPLYKLTINDTDANNKIYTLDFSKVGIIASGLLKVVTNSFIVKKYANTFIGAFGIDDEGDKRKINDVLTQLFATGVAGAKQKKLVISESPTDVAVDLTDLGGKSLLTEPTNIKKGSPSFEKFLMTLDDALIPI